MLTEQMILAGWRECPSSCVRLAWEATGGRWQQCWKTRKHWKTRELLPGQLTPKGNPSGPIWYRPVNPKTWDVDWRGWGAVVPTESGPWWRDDMEDPVIVRSEHATDDWYDYDSIVVINPSDSGLIWQDSGCSDPRKWVGVADDGHWIAPCVKPTRMTV